MPQIVSVSSISITLKGARGLEGMRHWLSAWLAEIEVPEGVAADVLLACWEATTNALRHPVDGDGQVEVLVEWKDAHVLACVSDHGRWRHRSHAHSHAHLGRGLGMRIIEGTMDHVQVLKGLQGTRVLMSRSLVSAAG